MSNTSSTRVLAVGPMPPEKLAYALARYSRSPDSIRESLAWVKNHDSSKFLESFYFQYGHASIADLGHVTMCFEGISELAATEIEDEQLWDGQARSSRYQDFSTAGVIMPPELTPGEQSIYRAAADQLLNAYGSVKEQALEQLRLRLPRPEQMKPEAYERNLAARAFDVARYLLPFGIPTGVGQVTSIRTLEKQIRRLRGSEFEELQELGGELARACAEPPACVLDAAADLQEPLAPTLARHANADETPKRLRADLAEWAKHHLPPSDSVPPVAVDLVQPVDIMADLCASLLYPITTHSYRDLYEWALTWPAVKHEQVINIAGANKPHHDELPKHFRSAPFVFDLVMDIGAYRDLHRHRRCYQLRQHYTNKLGYEIPPLARESGMAELFDTAFRAVDRAIKQLPQPAAQYLLPFAARSRFLFKMDFAELEYISRLRSGVKGHFAYRKIAWEMKCALERVNPYLASLINATPPWVEDPLKR